MLILTALAAKWIAFRGTGEEATKSEDLALSVNTNPVINLELRGFVNTDQADPLYSFRRDSYGQLAVA